MDEQEILRKIKEDSEQIEVPEELQPKQIEKMLESIRQLQGEWQEQDTLEEEIPSKKKKSGIRKYTRQVAAAAVVLVGACVLYAGSRTNGITDKADMASPENRVEMVQNTEQDMEQTSPEHLGDMYTKATDYGTIYDKTKKIEKEMRRLRYGEKFATMEDAAESAANGAASSDSTSTSGHSQTNLMTNGVDESDIVKTDGSYLYMVDGNSVSITDIRNNRMQEIAVIDPPMGASATSILELYVDGDSLVVIMQQEETRLQQSRTDYINRLTQEVRSLIDADSVYEMDTDTVTVAYSYDISNPKKPKLIGTTRQDGTYNTSRKIGDILYLFTNDYLTVPSGSRKNALKEENLTSWVPSVNEEAVAINDIYVGEEGQNSLVMASVNVKEPDKVLDTKMIVNRYVEIYVSSSSVFLYNTDWSSTNVHTQIAKFAMKDGAIQAVNAAVVMGGIEDAFAINEYQGYLRVLTTDISRGTEINAVYVLDCDMRQVGALTDIAPGETIYSARFMDNIGYFVTYRNMDPLFSVDFTDPAKPRLLGELKITGFSEYLHFWDKDKLLGIGYETDPDSGERLGIKLSMFDISDPSNVTEIGKRVLWGMNYSPALYNYKSVLADPGRNLIGLAVDTDATVIYQVYSYVDGQFVENLSTTIGETESGYWHGSEEYRGLYADTTFYLTDGENLVSYDMSDNWKKSGQKWQRLNETAEGSTEE